jgi:probable addiction module antidote protein
MMETMTATYDVAEFLKTPEGMAAYLESCIQESDGDAAFIAKALGDIARAYGMTQIARETGLSPERLYKALTSNRSPSFSSISKVISGLGITLSASVKEAAIVEDTAEVA